MLARNEAALAGPRALSSKGLTVSSDKSVGGSEPVTSGAPPLRNGSSEGMYQ